MFTTTKSALNGALALAGDIVERKDVIPILQNVLFDRGPAGLRARMTDLDIEATIDFEAAATIDFEAFTVPAHLLRDIVRKLADGGEIAVKPAGERRQSVTLRAGRSRFSLATLPESDFPALDIEPAAVSLEVDAPALASALAAVRFAISTEETRYYLNGIYLHPAEGGLMLVATDGHRLATRFLPMPGAPQDMPGVIVPRKTAGILNKCLPKTGAVRLDISPKKIAVTAGPVRLLSKLIDGTFPDYRRIIPQNNSQRAEIENGALKTAAERVMAVGGGNGHALRLAFGAGQLTLTVNNKDSASESEDAIEYTGGAEITLGVNGKYLLEVLAHLPDSAAIMEMDSPGSPIILRADGDHADNLIIVMPMRV